MRNYESDFAGWAEDTAQAILDGRWSEIDRDALADEVESLSRADKRSICSRFAVVFLYLLKQRYQPERKSRSWAIPIVNAREGIRRLIEESPSLTPLFTLTCEQVVSAYQEARRKASAQTGLPIDLFPENLPFTEDEIWGDVRCG